MAPTIITKKDADAFVIKTLKGKEAEIFASFDPETGHAHSIMRCDVPLLAVLLLARIVERMSKQGIGHAIIRKAVEIGLKGKGDFSELL